MVTEIYELSFFCGVSEEQQAFFDVRLREVRLREKENKKEEAIMIVIEIRQR